MFSVCNITTEVKPVAGLCQRICQDFKTRTRKTLSTYFTISNQYDLSKKDVKELQPVTKIVRLAHLPPLLQCWLQIYLLISGLLCLACFLWLGTTLSLGEGGILGNFKQV